MFYACVQKFDVTGTVENFLESERGLTEKFKQRLKQSPLWQVSRFFLDLSTVALLLLFGN